MKPTTINLKVVLVGLLIATVFVSSICSARKTPNSRRRCGKTGSYCKKGETCVKSSRGRVCLRRPIKAEEKTPVANAAKCPEKMNEGQGSEETEFCTIRDFLDSLAPTSTTEVAPNGGKVEFRLPKERPDDPALADDSTTSFDSTVETLRIFLLKGVVTNDADKFSTGISRCGEKPSNGCLKKERDELIKCIYAVIQKLFPNANKVIDRSNPCG